MVGLSVAIVHVQIAKYQLLQENDNVFYVVCVVNEGYCMVNPSGFSLCMYLAKEGYCMINPFGLSLAVTGFYCGSCLQGRFPIEGSTD